MLSDPVNSEKKVIHPTAQYSIVQIIVHCIVYTNNSFLYSEYSVES